MSQDAPRLMPYIGLYAIIHVIIMVIVVSVVTIFDIEANSGVAIGILVASAFGVAQKFTRDQGRVPNWNEVLKLSFGSLLASIGISAVAIGLFYAYLMIFVTNSAELIKEISTHVFDMSPAVMGLTVLLASVLFFLIFLSVYALLPRLSGRSKKAEQ